MSSGNGDRCVVVAHDLSEKFGAGQHRNTFFHGAGIFRVIRMDSSGVDNNLYFICDVGSTLAVINFGTFFLKGLGERA